MAEHASAAGSAAAGSFTAALDRMAVESIRFRLPAAELHQLLRIHHDRGIARSDATLIPGRPTSG